VEPQNPHDQEARDQDSRDQDPHDERLPPAHERDDTPPAPGDLELVRSFLSLHDHTATSRDSLPPSAASLAWWFHQRGLLADDERPSDEDLGWAAAVLEALRSRVFENMGAEPDPEAIGVLNRALEVTGLAPRFGDDVVFRADGGGVRGAIGRLLGIALLAQLDGSWDRFKECSSPTCRGIFWDRSKNRSGRWCSMSQCGNRAKVRAYRTRERAGGR
jgi:hypothetical protein